VRALFNSSNQAVTREQFEKFANALLDPAILNIAWVPRVRRDERVAHELAAAREGLPDYRIRAIAPDGSLSVSPEQDEYFPKSYSTEAKTSSAYGLDLKDGGARERTFDHIRDADVLSTSPPLMLRLTFGEGDPHGFLAAVSVYAPGLPHDTVEDRRRNLLGFVQGVFQIGPMVDAKFANVKTPVNLYLFPPNAAIGASQSIPSLVSEPDQSSRGPRRTWLRGYIVHFRLNLVMSRGIWFWCRNRRVSCRLGTSAHRSY
jgi:hypothetical protein